MAARKVDRDGRIFNRNWKLKYFVKLHGDTSAICVICNTVIAVLKEYNMKRDYTAKHSNQYDEYTGRVREESYDGLSRNLQQQQHHFTRQNELSESATKISLAIAEELGTRQLPFSHGDFAKQVLCRFVDEACPEKKRFLNSIQLSRKTMTRRVEALNEDIVKSLKDAIKDFVFFSLAIDESTDLSDTAQLAIMIRGVNQDFTIVEDFLAVSSMKGRTTGRDIYEHVIAVLEEYGLPMEKLAGVATDGAPAMKGDDIGFQGLIAKSRQWDTPPLQYHCIIHQQNLAAQALNMDHVMNLVVSTVNFIRSRALNHRQFKLLLDEVDSEYGDVTYYSKVRWLSRGAVLKRFWHLLKEVDQFTRSKNRVHEEFQDCQWLNDLAFLVDITQHMNIINKQLQGKNQLISKLWQHVSSFKTKLVMWRGQLEEGNFTHFSTISTRQEEDVDTEKYSRILGVLAEEFNSRFEQFTRTNLIDVFAHPTGYPPAEAPAGLQLELIDCQADDQLKRQFIETDLLTFYKDFFPKDTYPQLYRHALRMASLFGSTYLCEKFFSNMKFTKNKYRSRLTDEHLQQQLRLVTSTTRPNIQRIVDTKECQVSH